MMIKQTYRVQAFSLVELSVVLAIVGVLLGAILGGSQLIRAANIRNLIVEIEEIRTAIKTFHDTYSYYPGDFVDADDFWPSTTAGDGDGFIEFSETTENAPREDLQVWMQLGESDLLAGKYTGTHVDSSTRYMMDVNSPSSEAYTDGTFMVHTEDDSSNTNIYGTRGTTIRFGSLINGTGTQPTGNPPYANGESYPYGGIMTAQDARALDEKMDDGTADSGLVYSIRGSGLTGCVTAAWNAAAAAYDLDATGRNCSIIFWYQKF